MKLRSRAAHRYAQALHDLATGDAALEAVGADLVKIQSDLAGSGDLRGFIGNYRYASARRMQTLEALFSARVHPLVWRFIRFLESKRRLGLLDEICADFKAQEERRQGILRGRLTSAFALSSDDVKDIALQAGSRIRKQLILETEENPELLGGCRLQVGDTVYDFSLAARLRMIRQTMMAG
jgi:F-type H+-transporting ATPase subunit delta